MGYFVAFAVEGRDEPVDGDEIASNSGYASFQEWAANLPADYPELGHLGEHGVADDFEQLESDLEHAIRSRPGKPSEDVLHVARRLLAIMRTRPDDALALVVTDGTGEEDDDGEGGKSPDDDLPPEDAQKILAALQAMRI